MTTGEAWVVGIGTGVIAMVLGTWALAAFNLAFKEKVWRPVWRWIRWPFTLRPTTSTRQKALADELASKTVEAEQAKARFKEICDLLGAPAIMKDSTGAQERIAQLRDAKETAWAHAQKEIDATKSLAQRELAEQARRGAELAETARELGRQAGHAAAMAEVEAQRAAPQLQPQWRIDATDDSAQFMLRNTQPGVAVSDVSLTPPMGDFAFTSPSQWPGPADSTIAFGGERQGNGRPFGVRFVVRWRDVNGDHRGGEVFLDKEPRPPIVSAHSRVARLPPEPTNWT